jgi:hypothetical protein
MKNIEEAEIEIFIYILSQDVLVFIWQPSLETQP